MDYEGEFDNLSDSFATQLKTEQEKIFLKIFSQTVQNNLLKKIFYLR